MSRIFCCYAHFHINWLHTAEFLQLVKKCSTFYGTWRFITIFTSLQIDPIHSQMNPVNILIRSFFKIHFGFILLPVPKSPHSFSLLVFQLNVCMHSLYCPCVLHDQSVHPSWFDYANNLIFCINYVLCWTLVKKEYRHKKCELSTFYLTLNVQHLTANELTVVIIIKEVS